MILLQLVVLHQAGMYSCNLLDLYYRGAQFKSQPKYPEISHWFPSIRQGDRQDSSLFMTTSNLQNSPTNLTSTVLHSL